MERTNTTERGLSLQQLFCVISKCVMYRELARSAESCYPRRFQVFIISPDNNLFVDSGPASYGKKYIYLEITDMYKTGIYYLLAKHQ